MNPSSYTLPTFLDRTAPVHLITHLDSFEVSDATIQLRCGTKRYQPSLENYYGTICETVINPPLSTGVISVRLDFLTDEILRIRSTPGDVVPENETTMVVGSFLDLVNLEVSESTNKITCSTKSIKVIITREPWKIEIFDLSGIKMWGTRPVDIAPLRRPKDQWNPPQQRWLFLHRYAYPWGIYSGESWTAFASFDLHHDEHIFGLGEDFGPIDKRGIHRRLWLQEGFGNASPASYKQTPFFMSTRGYGVFLNTSNAVSLRFGELDHTAHSIIVEDTDVLDIYWIYGPGLKEILPRYTAITGQPALPPKWSFGLWMGRITYNHQDQVEKVAKELREHKIPCDLIHIDTGWYENEWDCNYCFGPDKFPDPVGMIERLRKDGYRVSLWQWPNLSVGSSIFAEGQEKGYFARRSNGSTYTYSGFLEDTALIDYSYPKAVAWVQEKIHNLLDMGVVAIKVDFGEGAPIEAKYHGVASESMHNLYPLLYGKAIFEVTQQVHGKDQAVIWARAGWAGSQRYPIHWSGDGIARFEDLACVLRSALSFGMSGFPFYSHDIGGFSGIPTPELYVRWAQYGLFSSHSRCHGEPPREPWEYGEGAEKIFRNYTELRYRLMPYIYSQAVESVKASLPMVRALVLEFQDDPTATKIDDQYLFGSNILVAPILDQTNHRKVYLPMGRWIDYWTKTVHQGPCWLEIEAPLDILPLYVRAGSILPYGPLCQYVEEKTLDPLTLEIYHPKTSNSYTSYEPDQADIKVEKKKKAKELILESSSTPGEIEIILFGMDISEVWLEDISLTLTPTENGGYKFVYDGRNPAEIRVLEKGYST